MNFYIVVLEGDGIGPEICGESKKILSRIGELISGIYFGEPRGIHGEGKDRYGVNTEIYRTPEVERIVGLAFDLAKLRRKKVTSVDKFNVLESSRLWHDVAEEVSQKHPDVLFEHQIVDNAAMQLILNPKQFDVLVTTNMFGDILSDEASMLTGSLGMLPSASLGGKVGLYEPSHGSAPDIAGTGKANPLAMILSVAMMLKYSFQLQKESDAVEAAVEKILNNGLRTADLAKKGEKTVSCKEMGDAVVREIK